MTKAQATTKTAPLAAIVAATDVMPRATDKEVRAAKKKAESAARVTDMVNEQAAVPKKRAGRRAIDPVIALVVIEPTSEGLELGKRRAQKPKLNKPNPIEIDPVIDVPQEDLATKVYEVAQQMGGMEHAPAALAAITAPEHKVEKVAPALPTTPYRGPMLALRDRLKAGKYAKMANGQPANGDELAQALGVLEPIEVIVACCEALDITNPYPHLNVGQQSMNLRNKLRTALKKGTFGMGVVREAVETQLDKRPQTVK